MILGSCYSKHHAEYCTMCELITSTLTIPYHRDTFFFLLVDKEAGSERLSNTPKVTQLVKGWAGIRVIMANIYWLLTQSFRLSILIPLMFRSSPVR